MSRIEEKREQKRSAIILAAQSVFASDGYIGASMDDIASRAQVTKQTVYRYFPSKEVLFKASLEARRKSDHAHFLNVLSDPDPEKALHAFSLGFVKTHLEEQHLASFRLLLSEGPMAPEMTRAHYAVGPAAVHSGLISFISSHYSPEDPDYAARMLTSTLLSLRMEVLLGLAAPPSQRELEEHVSRTVALFLRAMP